MSLYVYMMQGEYDDKLPWPFQGTLRIEVLTSSGEWKRQLLLQLCKDIRVGQRVTSGIGVVGWGVESLSSSATWKYQRVNSLTRTCSLSKSP